MKPQHAIYAADGVTVAEYVYPNPDGSLPEGAVEIAELVLENAKDAKWELVKAKRKIVEEGGAPTAIGVIDSDPDSQRKVNGLVTMAMLAAQASQTFSQVFTLADNSTVTLDGTAMINTGIALGEHIAECHGVAQTLRDAIDAATTVADVNAIDIEGAGWPS